MGSSETYNIAISRDTSRSEPGSLRAVVPLAPVALAFFSKTSNLDSRARAVPAPNAVIY